MRLENAVAADVLERILSAYGLTMQKELSDKLGIAKSNVASWLQREQVPGNVLVQCALDTGADVRWLVTGEFANANMDLSHKPPRHSLLNGQSLISKMLRSGGKPVLQRILEAYGFKTQKELSEYLGISTGTISTWVRREFFPGDVVITCSLDTKVSLEWLAIGDGVKSTPMSQLFAVPRKKLISGTLEDAGEWDADISFIAHKFQKPIFLKGKLGSWLADFGISDLSNGRWVLGVNDKFDIYDVILLPGRKINVTNGGGSFTCSISEVVVTGKIILTMCYNF